MSKLLTENQTHQVSILLGEIADWEGFLVETKKRIIEMDKELAEGYTSGDLLEEDAEQIRNQINMLICRKGRIYKVFRKINKEISEVENE
ncbi:MAG: hypothetical protein MUP44_09970 [Anaerolineales bacterium]|nr:hypothetical protein [Anaerolineales bacterium]